jgi:cytoskeletal protein CcmA (bactofilin family)/DNA-directed RNA polymerase subunit RPC12/RpoP
MPLAKQEAVSVACPKCGHVQTAPAAVYSTVCRKCRAHFHPHEAAVASRLQQKPALDVKRVICFQCGTELEVPLTADSTMCKRCSSHVDLRDYHITQAVSKNFRTHGRFVIEEKGYVFNTDSVVGDAVIKGKFIGKIRAERSLEIHSTADIRGTFATARLVVPAGNHFRWKEALHVQAAEIAGELVANVLSEGTVLLKSTARFFGDVVAGNLVVETGAVFVGFAKIGRGA